MRSRLPAFPRLRLLPAVSTDVLGAAALTAPFADEKKGWLPSFGMALAVEAMLVAAIAALFFLAQALRPPVETQPPTLIQLAELPPAPKPAPPEPPRPVEKHLPQPRQVAPAPAPQPEPVARPVASTEPSPFAEKVAAAQPVPSPPQAPAPPSPDLLADYMAKIRAAVQTALVYPAVGGELQFEGRVRVEFRLNHGVQSGARIILSSGFRIFDQAALAAVRNAQYPQPPSGLGGESRSYQVWVEFRS